MAGFTRERIKKQLFDVLTDKLGVSESDIELGKFLADDLNADSLDNAEIIIKLEDVFDIEINDSEARGITTVQNALDLLCNKIGVEEDSNV